MAWSIVGVSAVVEATTTAITLTEPAGVANGDLLIACFASRTTATTAISNTGWTAVNSQNNNNIGTTAAAAAASGTMLYQVRAGTPDLSFVIPAGISVALGRIVAYRGNASTTPLDVSTAATTAFSTTAVSVTGLTTTVADDLIVAMTAGGQEAVWSSFNATTPTGASGATDTTTAPSAPFWRERADSLTTTGVDTSLAIFDGVKTTAGATGNFTATASVSAAHVVIAGAFKISPPVADAWNWSDKASGITLSNGDKTATVSTAASSGVRSTTAQTNGTAGKYYAELFLNTASTPDYAGITPTSNAINASTTNFYVDVAGSQYIVNGSPIVSSIGSIAVNDVICIAWDAGAERVWFRINGGDWNKSGTANPATGVGGLDVSFAASTPHALWIRDSVIGAGATIRTELAEYTQTMPSGFTSWMGETPVSVTASVTGVEATGAVGDVTVTAIGPVTDRQYMLGGPLGVTFVSETSDRSYALAGGYVAETIDLGGPSPDVSVSVTGVQATGAVGSVTVAAAASVSVPVTGVEATGAVGTVTVSTVTRVDVAAPVTGVEAAGSVGSVTVTGKASTTVTGVAATGSVNAVTVVGKANVAVTGVQATGSVGSGTATGKAIAAVTGVSATGAVGTITVSLPKVVAVTGVAATGAVDGVTVAGKANATVIGVQAAGSVGSVTVTAGTGVTVPVTGIAATGSVDSVSITGKANVPLTGVSATGTPGGVSVTAGGFISTTVTGVQAVASVGSVIVTAAELAGLVSVWNGSAWVDKPAKVWSGSAWQQKPVKHWDGSTWI